MKVCIQAGHVNAITTGKGAPNEASFNLDVANQVSGELRKRGFEVLQTDANANKDPKVTGVDWAMFLAIHYDSDTYGKGGGFLAIPDPATDFATKESERIARAIEAEYFRVTGIKDYSQWQTVNKPYRKNANTDYYYVWQSLTAKTPCVLIECGVGMHVPDDHSVLHQNRKLVVEGIVRGVCKAFNVPYDTTPPADPCSVVKKQLDDMTKDRDAWKNKYQGIIEALKALTA